MVAPAREAPEADAVKQIQIEEIIIARFQNGKETWMDIEKCTRLLGFKPGQLYTWAWKQKIRTRKVPGGRRQVEAASVLLARDGVK